MHEEVLIQVVERASSRLAHLPESIEINSSNFIGKPMLSDGMSVPINRRNEVGTVADGQEISRRESGPSGYVVVASILDKKVLLRKMLLRPLPVTSPPCASRGRIGPSRENQDASCNQRCPAKVLCGLPPVLTQLLFCSKLAAAAQVDTPLCVGKLQSVKCKRENRSSPGGARVRASPSTTRKAAAP